MSVVKFDVAEFKALYPNIDLSDIQLEFAFKKAELRLNNTKHSVVCDLSERKILLYLLTAHIAILQQRSNDGNTLVGRISSSSEGSVSVSAEYPQSANALKGWFDQTQEGAEYWTLTQKYRSFRYIRSPFPTIAVNRWSR